MKKLSLLSYSIIVFANAVNCQVTKGNWMVGGNISFASTNYNSANYAPEHTVSFLKVNPNIGYFLTDKFAAGLKISVSKDKTIGGTFYTDGNTGPFLRYYFLSTENRINILAEGVYQYGFVGGINARAPKNTFAFTTGAVAFFNSSVGMEFLISYSSYKFSGVKGSNGTIQLGFGLQVHLEK